MKKLVFALSLVVLCANAAEKKVLTPEERAARYAEIVKRTGGPITIPAQGFVALIDCQDKVDFAKNAEWFKKLFEGFRVTAKAIKSTDAFTIGDLVTKRRQIGAGAVVFVVDDPALPMSLVSIESRSGLVNVAALAEDKPSKAVLTRRTGKMINRVGTLASGGAECDAPTSTMKGITSLKELDASEGQGDEAYVMMGMIRGLDKAGVAAQRKMSYKQACKQGIAPAPTNDIQKAIWDKVHAIPQTPMKIEFDPKKGR